MTANPSPGVLAGWGGPAYFGFVNVLVAAKFRKRLEQLQPETALGGRWENQWQNQGPRARGHSGVGEGSPDPRRERAKAPKHGVPIRNVA